jgi:hypothetical protein
MARPKARGEHRAPSDCPVCGDHLSVTRLGCGACGSEVSGVFASCEFCALDDADSDLLRVFLVSRGNMREVEKHLGVSYPTARSRFTALLTRLGLVEAEPAAAITRDQVLADVAAGRMTPAEAAALLADLE